jgi:chitinase
MHACAGTWETATGAHTPLQYKQASLDSVSRAVDTYLNAGVPASKLIMGLAAYGRAWTLANPSSHGASRQLGDC